jgi:hypothetical protein
VDFLLLSCKLSAQISHPHPWSTWTFVLFHPLPHSLSHTWSTSEHTISTFPPILISVSYFAMILVLPTSRTLYASGRCWGIGFHSEDIFLFSCSPMFSDVFRARNKSPQPSIHHPNLHMEIHNAQGEQKLDMAYIYYL